MVTLRVPSDVAVSSVVTRPDRRKGRRVEQVDHERPDILDRTPDGDRGFEVMATHEPSAADCGCAKQGREDAPEEVADDAGEGPDEQDLEA